MKLINFALTEITFLSQSFKILYQNILKLYD